MFALTKKVRFTVLVAAVAAASLMNSCGGKKASAAQVASQGGYETVTTPATELEDLKRKLEAEGIPAGIGIGESTDEMVSRNVSSDEARTEVAKSIDVHVQRLSESYAQNVSGEAKKIWEEAVRQITDQHVRGSNVHTTIVQFNKENGRYKVYSLIVLNPSLFKAALQDAMARDEEFELRVKKDEMMSKLDANIREYESKYKK
ncbi:MAG: hypothetical protein FWC23_04760 [Chitinispirillia bacterium]|nr:hypothetical protein [Chitinispirillia bacterium]MCL2268479.1 hypothetical protein [Chitinispirillia bacterium]